MSSEGAGGLNCDGIESEQRRPTLSTHDITDTGIEVGLRELDRRRNDGVEVTLYWEPCTDRVFVAVDDERRGASFRFEAAAARALEAFHHPYAFAPREAAEYALAA